MQPADWAAGDLCISCGSIARREMRCHWCTAFTPEGRFCRECGAETVADELYAPARMLKAAGVDQFSIGDRLAALDADHIAHLTRMYQKQSTLVAHQVDTLHWIEGFLVGSGWAQDLADELTARLPMPEAEAQSVFGNVTKILLQPEDVPTQMRSCCALSLNPTTAQLASLALVRHGWVTDESQTDSAESAFYSADRSIVDEAALAFGGWRWRFRPERWRSIGPLVSALTQCSHIKPAQVALRLLGEEVDITACQPEGSDADQSFAFALATVAVEPLSAALNDPQRRRAAGIVLAENGHAAILGSFFTDFDDETLEEILGSLRQTDLAYPTLHSQLWASMNRDVRQIRRDAAALLVTIGRAEDAVPLLARDVDDVSSVQDVLQRMNLRSADLFIACRYLVDQRRFRLSQYGVQALAENGRLLDDFIPSVWAGAADDEQRCDLLRFAGEQLNKRSNEVLHRFFINVVFAEAETVSMTVRADALWCLLRWYGNTKHAWSGPLAFDSTVLASFFDGGVPTFIERFLTVLRHSECSEHLTLEEFLGKLLRYSPEEGLLSVAGDDAFAPLVDGLLQVLNDTSRRTSLRCDIVRFFENNVRADRAMLTRVVALLKPFEHDDLEFEISTTITRLRGD